MNRPRLYDMFDDLYIDIGTPPFNVWKKELASKILVLGEIISRR